jgi:hypothetical protein
MPHGNCKCCVHPEHDAIDSALLAGTEKTAVLAARFNVSPFSLNRHRKNHLLAPLGTVESPTELEELELLRSRSEELYLMAAQNGDVRGLATALQQSLRNLEFKIRHREEAQKTEVRDLPRDPSRWTANERQKMQDYLAWIVNTPFEALGEKT